MEIELLMECAIRLYKKTIANNRCVLYDITNSSGFRFFVLNDEFYNVHHNEFVRLRDKMFELKWGISHHTCDIYMGHNRKKKRNFISLRSPSFNSCFYYTYRLNYKLLYLSLLKWNANYIPHFFFLI